MITAMIMKAMLGISLLINIEKLFKGGTAPPPPSGDAGSFYQIIFIV